MNTRPQEALSYRDLARQQARISRQVDLGSLDRLSELVREGNPVFEVTMQFSMDPAGRPRVDGTISGELTLNCHGCAESLVHPLALSFGCLIAETEAMADVISEGEELPPADVLVAGGTEISMAQIVEDELLLSLPERLCTSTPCERSPVLAYPAEAPEADAPGAGVTSTAERVEEDNPFSVLRALKTES